MYGFKQNKAKKMNNETVTSDKSQQGQVTDSILLSLDQDWSTCQQKFNVTELLNTPECQMGGHHLCNTGFYCTLHGKTDCKMAHNNNNHHFTAIIQFNLR